MIKKGRYVRRDVPLFFVMAPHTPDSDKAMSGDISAGKPVAPEGESGEYLCLLTLKINRNGLSIWQ